MALQHFRSALNGFNRQDVVNYIEYLNNQYNSKIEQLNSRLNSLSGSADPQLQARLDAALARIDELEAQLAQEQSAAVNCTAEELEAYRRAERTERAARERAQQIHDQANAVLADITLKAEAASQQIGILADQVSSQLQQYQASISGAKDTFQDAVASLYALRPEE